MSMELAADELTLPIKRTDGDTIEERLTGNAYHNILPARYLRKDSNGDLIEQQEDLFERVAKNIALAEAAFEADKRDIEVTVTPDQVKPDHPRRDELAEEVFGTGVGVGDDAETALTEYNVNKFAYETVVPELPPEVRDHVETTAAEFREAMEQLSFMPNCVPPDSLVAAGGGMKQLSDVEPGDRVYDDEGSHATVEETYRNGEKLVVEIETESGYSVRATPEHYFRVIDENGEYEWRQVKDLEPGHALALQKNFLDDEGSSHALEPIERATDGGVETAPVASGRPRSRIEMPDSLTPEFAEWLGLYIGDGTARESGVRVAFDETDPDLVTHWCELTEALFGFEPTTRVCDDAACVIGQAFRRDLYAFLDHNDLLKGSSTDATVPEAILKAGRTPVASFLRGLFEADGTVGDRSIELYTHSETLGRQVQQLLLGLGIRSKLSEKRDGYRVTIRKNACGKRFVEQVGLISDRKCQRADRFREVSENATSITIPNQGERLLEWYRESDLGHDAYRDLSQFLIDSDSDYHQEIGTDIFERYAAEYPELWESPVAEHVERDQIYESVSSITELGTMSVEDMQVPRRNTYVVEGFVSHNSPTLMNAGDELQQLSACFVDSPEDDIDDIHQTAKEAAQVFQCLTAETKVCVEGEGVTSIADVEPGDRIVQRDDDSHQVRNVAETHAYDDSPVHRVVTEAGIGLTGTPNHELLVNGEWSRIDEIEPGDTLSLRLGWISSEDATTELTTVASGAQWAEHRTVSNDDVLELYAEGLSDYEIADRLDSSASTIQRRRSLELGLDPNGSGGRPGGDVSFDEDEFEHLYGGGHSDGEIAAELGVSTRTVARYRQRESLDANGDAVKAVRQPTEFSADLAELLGMWVGDGSKHEDGIRFHLNREETLERADRLCRDLFEAGLDWRWENGCYEAVVHSHEVKRWWLANFGDAKPDATTASVPEAVWEADRDATAAFLRGLFSTDGSLQKDVYPRLWSSSEELVDDVQQLLLGIGIPATQWEYDADHREYFNVGPTGERGLAQFIDTVGFVDSRTETMAETFETVDSEGPSVGTLDGATWKVPVEAVEDAGTATVYDLTVADNHEYVASSVVSHNSGGGMGYAFWRLRPYGDQVGSTGGIASGPITFMRTFDQMCFPPGTDVLTPSGYRPIESLERGEPVVDENGDERPVVETMERHVAEDIVEITPERLNEPIQATGEHPFQVARDGELKWVDACDLEPDDLLVLGHDAGSNDLELDGSVDLTTIASGPLVFTDGGITVNRDYYGASKGTSPNPVADEVSVADFATIAGWYLAEGCVVYRRGIPSEVTFTLNHDEQDAVTEICEALESFDASTRVEQVPDRNTVHVHVESASFAQLIEGLFGTGAAEKTVPELLWKAPPETQARILEALFDGDGKLEKRGKSQRAQLKLANEEIVDFVFQAGLRCGVQFSRHNRTPDDRKPTFSVSVSVSSALGTPLERLFDETPDDFAPRDRTKQAAGCEVVAIDELDRVYYEGPVYNIEVPETHSYVAEDVVVHNCETIAQGGARRGAQMGVMRVSHPDVIQFIHAKNKDVSLANTLRLNDPDDFTHNSFAEALEEARELIDDDGRVPEHLRNAVEGHLSNFNISVGITDRFMDAVKNDEEYTFTNPRTGEPHVATAQTVELYEMFGLGEYAEEGEVLSVPAREVWERIVEGAHENGEPGVIYLERVNKQHSFDVEEHPDHRILATNPCLTGDTLISTEDGLVPAEELYERGVARDIVVDGRLSEERLKEASSVYKTGTKDVYRLTTEEGYELRLTADHRVMTDEGWVEAGNLDSGDTVHIQNRKGGFGQHGSAEEGRVLGWMVGDGHLKHGEERAVLNFYDEDAEISEQFADDVNEVVREPLGNADYEIGVNEISRGDDYRGAQAVEQRIRSSRLYECAEDAGLVEEKHQVPDAVMRGSEQMARGFLRALFTADGSVQGNKNRGRTIRLANASLDLLREAQQLLLNFGIASKIYEDRKPATTKELPDGTGGKKEYETGFHDLVVSKENMIRFRDEIGFLREDKNEQLDEIISSYVRGPQSETFTATVESVDFDGNEEVYDLTEPDTHSLVSDGIVTHNCGEQPLEEYEACNLGHINLSTLAAEDAPDWRVWSDRHAHEYDSKEAAVAAFLKESIDWESFDRRIELGTRFLENVVTMSDFPVDQIEETVREMRKIGLGIMGLAQLYIQLGMKYGSDPANEVARQLMTHINHESKWTSHELAQERGVFAEWDNSKYADPTEYREWFEHQTGLDADEWADGFPIRNHNTTTIAPTGCVEENSLVSTDEGLVPIKNLDETTAEFEQWGEIEVGVSTDGGIKAATAIYDNGFADVRRIETEGGFSVASTPDHRFRTITRDGEYAWKEADEFEPGDRILLQRNTFDGGSRVDLDTSERSNYYHNTDDDLQLPAEMTPELAEFLGYFMGDGYVHDEVGVKLVVESDAEELDDYLRALGRSVFGVTPTVEDRNTRHMLTFGGRHLSRYFADNDWKKDAGNEGEGAASAFVPEEVLRGDEDIAKAFLRGLFEADGTASRKVELSTVSSTLAEQVQTLLLSLGCVFVQDVIETEEMEDHYGDRPRHSVRGANKREDKRFIEEIGFITKSTEFDLTPQSYRNDTYPPAVVEAVRDVEDYDSVSKPVKKRVNQSPINGAVSRKLVRDVEEETGETVRIDGRRLSDFYAATVDTVTEEKAYTKDISVPSNNTYVANGFVTHNTTSMVGNTTGGCEPIYNVAYYKNVSDDVQGDEMLVEFDDYFLRVLDENDIDVEAVKQEAQEQMADNEFDGVDGLTTVPDAVGELFVTTGDLSAKEHAGVQTACQEGVDSAISKCLEAGTLVQTDSGVRLIESFVDEPMEPGEFVDVEEDVTIDGVPVESQYYAGEKDATRVRVDNGTELVGATESHKVLTPGGWTVLGDLEEGDYVVGRHTESHGDGGSAIDFSRVKNVLADGGATTADTSGASVHEKDVTLPAEMSPRLARFLGMYAADGSAIDSRYSIEISTSSEHVRDEVRELFTELFGREPSVDVDTRHGEERDTVYGVHLNSKPVWEFVTELCGSGSYDKEVPDEVLSGSPEEKLAFVNGVTLDGYVSSQSLVVYGGMSETLADGIASLLRSFGVPKVYVGRKWVDDADAYAYQVHVTNDVQELVTPIEPHKRVDTFEQRYRVYVPQDRVDKTEFHSRSTAYYAARNFEYRNRNYMFDTTAEQLGITDAPPLYEVTDVEDAGTREMYDIELAGPHEYVVGGVVSHNTVNAPNSSTVEDAKEVFEYIYDHGGKGVTYYRDGTRSKQVLTTRAQNTEFAEMDEAEVVAQIEELFGSIDAFVESEPVQEALDQQVEQLLGAADGDEEFAQKRPRPDVLHGVTQRIETGYGKLYVNINEDPEADRPFELFANIGNSGGFTGSFTEALAKTISVALRAGVDPEEIAEKLQGIRSPKVAWDKGEQIQSIPDAIGTAMQRYLDGEVERAYPQQQTLEETAEEADRESDLEATPDVGHETDGGALAGEAGDTTDDQRSIIDAGESPECPECGSLSLYYAEGCKTCESCGWSEC